MLTLPDQVCPVNLLELGPERLNLGCLLLDLPHSLLVRNSRGLVEQGVERGHVAGNQPTATATATATAAAHITATATSTATAQ